MSTISILLLMIGCAIIVAGVTQAFTAGQTLARSRIQSSRLYRNSFALVIAGAILTSLSGVV